MVKKVLSQLLLVLLLLQVCCGYGFAEETVAAEDESDSAPEEITISSPAAIQAGDHLLLGSYNERPVEWIVLDNSKRNDGEPGLFLFAAYVVQESGIIYSTQTAVWAGSPAQESCGQFYNDAFSEVEKALIPAVTVHEDGCEMYGLTWQATDLTDEYVFYLSVPELAAYFGTSNGSAGFSATTPEGYLACYWLRSPQDYTTYYAGTVYGGNYENVAYIANSQGGRPATNLNTDNIFYLTQAGTTADGITIWRAAMQDESADFALTGIKREEDTLTLSWQTSDFGENRQLAVLILDADGQPTGIKTSGTLNAESGTTEINLSELTVPDGGSLAVCELTSDPTAAIDVLSVPVSLTCTVSFEAGEGSGTMDPMTAQPGTDVQLPACTFTAPEGKKFNHWRFDGGTIPDQETVTVSDDMVLEAVYTEIESSAPQIVTDGGTLSLNSDSLTLTVGYNTVVCATVANDDAGLEPLQWTTDRSGVVRLKPLDHNTCRVTSLWPGNTTLTCLSADGSSQAQMQITVTGSPVLQFLRTQEGIAACVFLAVGLAAFFMMKKRVGKFAIIIMAVPIVFLIIAIAIFFGLF